MTLLKVEQIAKAMAKAHDWSDWETSGGLPPWKLYVDDVVLMLQLIRTPSPRMLKAAGAALSRGKRPTEKRISVNAKHALRYRSMIDAELTAYRDSTEI